MRPSFNGVFIRSIQNESINNEWYSEKKRKLKMLLSIIISMVIICAVLVTVYFIFVLKDYMTTNGIMEGWPIINNNSIPGFLNTIQIMVFNFIYQMVSNVLNEYENHESFSSYESSLVIKIFLFQFVNTFNSCFIIAFLSDSFPSLDLCVVMLPASAARFDWGGGLYLTGGTASLRPVPGRSEQLVSACKTRFFLFPSFPYSSSPQSRHSAACNTVSAA